MIHTTLESALTVAAERLKITPASLIEYAREDQHGGRDDGAFPRLMSPYKVEGQFLYALIRALHPETVLEIGCGDGGSATHILAALQANNYGRLISVDLVSRRVGWMIPVDLQGRWDLIVGNARDIDLPEAEVVFEDADHTYDSTRLILSKVKAKQPRAVISHDYAWEPGVKKGFDEVFGEDTIQMNFADSHVETGMACWISKS